MGRDRGARPGTSSGPGGKARSGQITGATQLSLLSAKNAGHTGLNWITQAVSSTSTWYAFAGHVNNRRTLLMNGGKLGCRPRVGAWNRFVLAFGIVRFSREVSTSDPARPKL